MCWTKETYTKKATRRAELKSQIEALQKELDALDDAIKADMGANEEQDAGPFLITYKTINEMRFDSTAFKAKHKKLYESFRMPRSYRRFAVTAR